MEQYESEIRSRMYLNMIRWRQSGGIASKIYWMTEDLGLRVMISRFFNWKNNLYFAKHPSVGMQSAKDYFLSHKEDIEKVISILQDDESRETYRKIIRFRQTMNNSDLPSNSYKSQYFGHKYFTYHDGEVLVDCGAYDGDTVRQFKKEMKKEDISKYTCVCFEPDAENFRALSTNHKDAVCYQAGVWNKTKNLLFYVGQGDASKIIDEDEASSLSDEHIISILVKSIDETECCNAATFIKMDIEGSEKMAIQGAKNTILRNKPKLAICIYHSDEDMIEIPLMIHEMVPEYKLYIKHHSNGTPETVLYATL